MAKIDTTKLKSPKTETEEELEAQPSVSAGPVDRVIELAFNPSRDKIREVTVIDFMQARLFPQLDMVNMLRRYCLEVAHFRQNPEQYKKLFKKAKPIQPDAIDELLYRTAQWQKSRDGRNLEKAVDIALAETEARAGEEEDLTRGADAWGKE